MVDHLTDGYDPTKRPNTFDGQPQNWHAFKRKALSKFASLDIEYAIHAPPLPQEAPVHPDELIDFEEVHGEEPDVREARLQKYVSDARRKHIKDSSSIYIYLAHACVKKAQKQLVRVPRQDGYKAWEALCRANQSPDQQRLSNLQREVMTKELSNRDDPDDYFAAIPKLHSSLANTASTSTTTPSSELLLRI